MDQQKNDEISLQACALLIGVGNDLPATEKDAKNLYEILADPQMGGYSTDRIKLLTGNSATAAGIREGFTWLVNETKKSPASTAVVFYSGHGGVFESFGAKGFVSNYYLLPFDYDQTNLNETALSGTELSDLAQAVNARKMIVFLDCCHAGGIPVFKDAPKNQTFKQLAMPAELIAGLEAGSGRVAIASSRDTEVSIAKGEYSIFTDSLIKALRGAAARYDRFVRILEVLSFLFRDVPTRTKGRQNPMVKGIQNLTDNFALCLASEQHRINLIAAENEQPLLTWDEYQNLTAELDAQFKIKNAYRDRVNDYRVQQALNFEVGLGAQNLTPGAAETRYAVLDNHLRELETLYLNALKDLYSLRERIDRGWREPKLYAQFVCDKNGKIRYSKTEESYEIRLFIEDSPADTKSVTYSLLDESFDEPERQATKSDPQFEEFITSYGEFSIAAVLRFDNGTELKIVRWLSSALEDFYRSYPPPPPLEKAVATGIERIANEYFE